MGKGVTRERRSGRAGAWGAGHFKRGVMMRLFTLSVLSFLIFTGTSKADTVQERSAVLTWYDSFVQCVTNRAVGLGMSNNLDPVAIGRRAANLCPAEWKRIVDAMIDGTDAQRDDAAVVERLKSEAAGKAASAVVEMREGSCGTRPSNPHLRCLP